ncbi:MAG: ABC transporter permease [Deltaproteobacteria bacterium]|nr:ABC transporter permease [Deltaproteobacteria bacterium]
MFGGYFFRQAWQNLKQSPWLNAITLGTISLSFLILGLFLLVFLNTQALMEEWGSRIRVTAFLADSLGREGAGRLRGEVRNWPGVEDVEYRSKEQALKVLEGALQGRRGLLEGLAQNPLPASLEIRLDREHRNSIAVRELAGKLKEKAGVQEVQFGSEWVERFSAFMAFLKILGLSLGGLLLLATLFVISNTMRLNIFARREEIEIMRYVGATGFFIRAPFYIEGLLQGLWGAGVALAMLFGFFHLFYTRVYEPLRELLGPFPLQFLRAEEAALLLLGGMVLGLLGTQASVGRYLRV